MNLQEKCLARVDELTQKAINTNYDYYQSYEDLERSGLSIYRALRVALESHSFRKHYDFWAGMYGTPSVLDWCSCGKQSFPCPELSAIAQMLEVTDT